MPRAKHLRWFVFVAYAQVALGIEFEEPPPNPNGPAKFKLPIMS